MSANMQKADFKARYRTNGQTGGRSDGRTDGQKKVDHIHKFYWYFPGIGSADPPPHQESPKVKIYIS